MMASLYIHLLFTYSLIHFISFIIIIFYYSFIKWLYHYLLLHKYIIIIIISLFLCIHFISCIHYTYNYSVFIAFELRSWASFPNWQSHTYRPHASMIFVSGKKRLTQIMKCTWPCTQAVIDTRFAELHVHMCLHIESSHSWLRSTTILFLIQWSSVALRQIASVRQASNPWHTPGCTGTCSAAQDWTAWRQMDSADPELGCQYGQRPYISAFRSTFHSTALWSSGE